jgi:uncharacterized delta-60 repeat protein
LTPGEASQITGTFGSNDTIEFASSLSGQTITLGSTLPALSTNVAITGLGSTNLFLSGAEQYRVLQVNQGVTASISGLTIEHGQTSDINGGGAIYNAGTLTLSNSTLDSNLATNLNGGGGGISNFGTLTVNGSTFTGNSTQFTITGFTITGNSGGGISNFGTLTVNGSTFTGNSAYYGGAINNLGTLTVSNSTFASNSALKADGGAIDNSGALTVSNSTFAGNSAYGRGGGIENPSSEASILTNVTIAYNRCNTSGVGYQGGGLSGDTDLTLNNTIVADNINQPSTSSSPTPDDIAGAVNSASEYNLIGTGGSGGLQNSVNGNQVEVANPGLDSLPNYSAPKQTIALLPGSPAIGGVPANTTGTPATDERGFPRNTAAATDIGAFEVQPVTSAILQQALSSTSQVTLQANTTTDANTAVTAVNGLMASHAAETVTVTLDLVSAAYTDVHASPPGGVTLVINGNGPSTTIVGQSPALTVSSGNVIVSNVALSTATDDPTIMVTGGSLTLRNDNIQGTTGFSGTDTVISAIGGSLDLGTAQNPGGNTLNSNDSGPFIDNRTGNSIPQVGNTFEVNGTVVTQPLAFDDSYTAYPNQALNVPALGVLGNDTDPNGSPLTAILVSGPSHGKLSWNGDGSFSYTPATNFNQIDSFTYQARTASGVLSNIATVTITISTLDTTFGNGGIVQTPALPGSTDDEADRAFPLPNGQLMVVGITQQPSDYAVTISRYQADGTLDTTFGTGGTVVTGLTSPNYIPLLQLDNNVFCQRDGSITIGWGTFANYFGSQVLQLNELTRYGPDGTLDPTFGNGTGTVAVTGFTAYYDTPHLFNEFSAPVFTVQSDGTILIAGGLNGGLNQNNYPTLYTLLEKLNSDGSLDTSFGTNGDGEVIEDLGLHEELTTGSPFLADDLSQPFAIAVQADGSILVGGYTINLAGNCDVGFVARFRQDGSLDTSFGANGEVILVEDTSFIGPAAVLIGLPGHTAGETYITSITPQPDGKMIVDIDASSSDGPSGTLVRLNQDGTLDSNFASDGTGRNGFFFGGGWTLDGSGGLLTTQSLDSGSTRSTFDVTRYNPDGTPDLSFGPGGTGTTHVDFGSGAQPNEWSLAVQGDGKILLVGTVCTDGQTNHVALARLIGNVLSSSGMQYALNGQPPVNPATGDPTVTVQASTQTEADAFLALFQNPSTPGFTPLTPPAGAATPTDISLTLASGISLNEAALVIPQGIRVQINGGTWYGGSPALTLSGGDLTITGATFLNATDAPTILVTGGHLTLRNDVIQESTGFNDAALSVTGGTVDLGTATDPGGNTINVNGTGTLVQNSTSKPIAAVGDAFTVNGVPLAPSSLSGVVWEDFNDDGQVDFGEQGISGVTITLTGKDFLGNAVSLSQETDSDGAYVFLNLMPGTYTLTETQPAGYLQGIDSVGTAGGSLVATDQFSVPLGQGVNGLNYNFGEQPAATGPVQKGQTAGIGFWNNKNGQALIKSLPLVTNADGSVTSVANWLAATLPSIFGANSGNNLAGKSNAYVAALFQQDFLQKGVKLDAQVLAAALSVYVTNATLDSTQVAAQYGFTVNGDGAGTATVSVGSNGDAFGVARNTTLTVMDLLLATDDQAIDGLLYGGNAARRNEANAVYSAVNQAGGM